MLIIPLVLRTRSNHATVAHLVRAISAQRVKKASEASGCDWFLKGPRGEWEWFSIRYTLQKIMSKFKGANPSEVYLETQQYELHRMNYRTYSYPSNSSGTVQRYSYPLLYHTSESSPPLGTCAVVLAFSYFFNNLIAFFLEAHSCALVCSLINFFDNFFNTLHHLSITTTYIHLSKHYGYGG